MEASDIQKYKEFFEVDENYFPCIDDSAIEAGASWEDTYPHKAFIDLLKNAENMLGGTTKRSLWIHGAYAFEGITSGLDVSCKGLAKGLANKGILVQTPIGNNKYAYGAAVLAGDQARIEELKKSVRQSGTTVKLVNDGKLSCALALTPPIEIKV